MNQNEALQNPRVIVVQKLYSHHFNKKSEITFPKHRYKKFYKSGEDKLIKNYGIGAQIIKALNIKKMILVTRSKKKVIGLEGYGIKITKQEIIKWEKKFV